MELKDQIRSRTGIRSLGGPFGPLWASEGPGSAAWGTAAGRHRAHAGGGLTPALDLELLEDVVDVVLDRADLDRELPGYLLVGETLVDQNQDLALPGGEKVKARVGLRKSVTRRARQGGDSA
jgi:hypothetical protein